MKNRFFSPDSHQKYEYLLKQRHLKRLQSIGTTNKFNSPAHFKQTNEVKVSNYVYYKNRILGSGYSSKVYMAHKMGDETLYAMKVINLRYFKQTNIQMLKNQIQIIKNLNHPNVLRCYDIIKSATHCYIVTEYCPNGDLMTYLNKRGKVSNEKATSIIEQVIKGYQYLIKMNVIHRDLKPANILRSGATWKIADFGFAVISTTSFQSKFNVGTPLYMPLQSLVDNIYSHKSDIFSIGVMLYELLSGCTPWQSKSEKDLVRKMKSQTMKIPPNIQVSNILKQILEKMCDINQDTRMNKEQFLQLNIRQYQSKNERLMSSLELHFYKQRSSVVFDKKFEIKKFAHRSAQILPYHKQRYNSPTLPDTEEEEEHALKKIEIKNNHIIINQLHYCRFLYYFTRNRQYLLLDCKTSQKIVLIVFKHLISLVSHLADKQRNWFELEQWDKFIQSKRYKNTATTVKQYEIRYKKQHQNYLQLVDPDIIQEVDEQFHQIHSLQTLLTQQFYVKILEILLRAIKGFSNVLGIILNQQETQFGPDEVGQVEALNFLYKYYQLISIGVSSTSNYVYFQAHNQIKVHIDYQNSGATRQKYLQLIKKIEKCL